MPTDLEVVEADEAAGNERPMTPRGRILVFALLVLTFVILAVLSTFRKQPTERADWVTHEPGTVIYRIDQPHLSGTMRQISRKYPDLHDDLCHQLDLPTTGGGAIFRARSVFLGIGRSHFGKIPGIPTGTNEFTLFVCRDGAKSCLALVEGDPGAARANLLLLEHRVDSKNAHHTTHLRTPDAYLYPTVRTHFGATAYLTGSTMMTGDSFTNVVDYYETNFRPQRLGTAKTGAFRIPPADAGRRDSYTVFLQTVQGPKLIRVTEDKGLGVLTVANFKP